MSDFEEPGYAERDDNEFSEQTGGGVDEDETSPVPDEGAEFDDVDDVDADEGE